MEVLSRCASFKARTPQATPHATCNVMCLSDEIMVLEEEAIKCVLQQVNRRIVGTCIILNVLNCRLDRLIQ